MIPKSPSNPSIFHLFATSDFFPWIKSISPYSSVTTLNQKFSRRINISSQKIQIHHFEAPKGMPDYYRHEYRRLEYGFWIRSVRPYLNISLILTNFFPPLQSFPLNGINSINRTEIGFFRDNSTKGMISSKFKSRWSTQLTFTRSPAANALSIDWMALFLGFNLKKL